MNSHYQKIIQKLGKKMVRVGEPMANHTTFGIGGPADLFYEAKTKGDLTKAVKLAYEIDLSILILGGGSNLLVSDEGFRGLVIKASNSNYKTLKADSGHKVVVGSGMRLSDLLKVNHDKGLTGLEFLVGIPGTVGGAVRGNAGAWLRNIGDFISSVKILNQSSTIQKLKKEDCLFSYRSSRFQKSGEVILEVNFLLKKGNRKSIESKINHFREKRECQPKNLSAGCVFKNPKPKVAGLLIDQCGLKGKTIGQAQISPQHANFIVNLGGAKASDVVALMTLAKKAVKQNFEVELEEEIQLVGFDS